MIGPGYFSCYPEGSLKGAPWLEADSRFEACRCRICSKQEPLNEDDVCQDCFDAIEENGDEFYG